MSFNLFRPELFFSVMQPAQMSFSKDIQNIALIDRVETEASKEAVDLLYRDLTLISQPRFKVGVPVNAQRKYANLNISRRSALRMRRPSNGSWLSASRAAS